MKVIWSKESLRQLIEIENFIASDNPGRAEKFVLKLIECGEKTQNFPFKGRMVPEFSIHEIREVFYKNYRIVYRVSENQIEILTVFEGHKLINYSKKF